MTRTSIILALAAALTWPLDTSAKPIQSRAEGGDLWARREGAELVVGRGDGEELRLELPPGAVLRDLEPTVDGWWAAGRLPSSAGTDLLILKGNRKAASLLPNPRQESVRYRGQPVLMLDEDRLVGLAWMAGDGPRRFGLWTSSWSDEQWGPAELVSPPGPGSQLAPAGEVLQDGSWLLVWTAFDGSDDEIVFSHRAAGRWSRPERLHAVNEVPDLKPDLVAIEGGALAVWSWFDGNDYRLKTARWSIDGWRESAPLGGKGSGEATWHRTDEAVCLLYRSVDPPAWSVLELDRAGHPRRSASVVEESHQRPRLRCAAGRAGALGWPSGDRVLEWRDLR